MFVELFVIMIKFVFRWRSASKADTGGRAASIGQGGGEGGYGSSLCW